MKKLGKFVFFFLKYILNNLSLEFIEVRNVVSTSLILKLRCCHLLKSNEFTLLLAEGDGRLGRA